MVDRNFAEYEPRRDRPSEAPPQVQIRLGTHGDIDACVRLLSQFSATDGESWHQTLARTVDDGEQRALFVAELDETLLGYGRAVRVNETGSEGNPAPAGWYLLGVVVGQEWRRRGVGAALTRSRLEWIAERADTCWCFIHAANRASIDLHARFGFVEVSRDQSLPGMPNPDRQEVLFRLDLSGPR
jgi:GNAT superfamily N-acetyltransferase